MPNKSYLFKMFSFSLLLMGSYCFADSELDAELYKSAKQAENVQAGQALYEQVCASCHAKDLSGASGFDLKDGEWVHGGSPSDILANVKEGFQSVGMPGFSQVFPEPQLKNIVSYIISKREGFEGLTYRLYQTESEEDTDIDESKLIKSGALPKNLADFQIPEIKHYVIVFEGDFYVPEKEGAKIWVEWGAAFDIDFEVDGEVLPELGEPWVPLWQLKPGKQKLKITFRTAKGKPGARMPPIIIVNNENSIKLFAASNRAKSMMNGMKLEVKAEGKTVIQRKKVHGLPRYSISVGLPQKLNYAFNTRSCSIVGLWQGDLLNVGPNVGGRGLDGSLPLGEWAFKDPDVLGGAGVDLKKCKYEGYTVQNGEPVFNYKLGKASYSVSVSAESSGKIHFNYQVDKTEKPTFALPSAKALTWHSEQGRISDSRLDITPDSKGKFTITATIAK